MAGALETAARALDELGFFSKALEEAKGAKMKSGTPQQWMNVLKKQGVKPAELEATGFTNMLGEKPNAQLAKDDVVKFLTDNRLKLAEPTNRSLPASVGDQYYDAERATSQAYRDYAQFVENNRDTNPEEAERLYNRYLEIDRVRGDLHTRMVQAAETKPKFGKYTLPGGANYTEAKLQLPPPVRGFSLRNRFGERSPVEYSTREDAEASMRRGNANPDLAGPFMVDEVRASPRFRSSHWDEPDIVSHYRTKDRTGPNGERVLHIDEIQSDWAQAGRKQGFIDPEAQQRAVALQKQLNDAVSARNRAFQAHKDYIKQNHPEPDWDPFDGKMYNVEREKKLALDRQARMNADPEYKRLTDELHAANDRYSKLNDELIAAQKAARAGSVNPGPFVGNTSDWTDLTLKRALLRAQQEGYDAVALTPGAEQANRYDLSKQVERLYILPYDDGTYEIGVVLPDGSELGSASGRYDMPKLESTFGRDIAQRIKDQQWSGTEGNMPYLEGEGLSLGGEGMKAFYDRMVPDRLMSLARKLDPEAKFESMPAGRRLGIDHGDMSQDSRLVLDYGDQQGFGREPVSSREFPTLDEAEDYVQANHWPRGGEIPQLPMLRLTPRMKEQLAQGLPLFVGAPVVAGGALSTLDQPQERMARGGLAQAKDEARERMDEAYGDEVDVRDRYFLPGFDRLVAMKQPLGDMARPRLPEVRGFADGGEAEYDGPGGGYEGSTQQGIDAYNGSQNTFDANQSYSDWASDYYGGGGGGVITDPNDPAAQYNPGDINFNTEQSYNDWADSYYGGNDPTSDASEAMTFGLGFDLFSPSPLASMQVDFTPPQTSFAGPVPAEYVAPEQTIPGTVPTGGMQTMADMAAPMGLGFDIDPREQDRESRRAQGLSDVYGDDRIPSSFNFMDRLDRPQDDLAAALGDRQYGGFGLNGPQGANWGPGMSPTTAYVGNPAGTAPGAYGGNVRDDSPTGYNYTGGFSPSGAQSTGYGGQVGGASLIGSLPDPVLADDTGMPPMEGRFSELGRMGPTMSTAQAREQFTREYMRDRLTETYGRPPTNAFLDAMLGRFKLEAPDLLSGAKKDQVNHIGATGLMQVLGERKANLMDFRREQDPSFGNLRKDLDYAVQTMSPKTVEIGVDFNNQRDFNRFADAVTGARTLADGMRAMNAYERAENWNGWGTPINSVGGGRAAMGYAREFQDRFANDRPANVFSSPVNDVSTRTSSLADEFLGYAPDTSLPDVIGAQMKASAETPSTKPGYGRDFYEPNSIGYGLGFSPFGAAGTPAFGPAMGSISPMGGMLGATPSGLPSFVAQDMAQQAMPGVFGQPTVHEYIGPPTAPGSTIAGRAVEDYGFSGPAVGYGERSPSKGAPAPAFEGKPIEVATLPEPAPLPPERPADLTDDGPAAAPRSLTMNERIAAAMGATANRRDIDPLTRSVYDPVTGYTYPVDPLTMGKVVDGVLGIGVPIFGQLNGLSRLFGGPSVGGVMAQGVPGGWDSQTAADGSDRAFGNAGADSRDPQYLSPAPSSPIPAPAPTPATSTTPPTDPAAYLAYLRRRYMGEDADPKTYGMRPMRSYFSYE